MEERTFVFGPPAWIEWNGQRWYRMSQGRDGQPHGHYRNPGGDLLHRIVWERENGPIPPGLHVHHVDEDKANNALANLRLLTVAEHLAMHPGRWEHPGWTGEQSSERARARANNLWATREPRRLVCVECGAEFFSTGMRSKFCHQNCRARRRRRILKEAALS